MKRTARAARCSLRRSRQNRRLPSQISEILLRTKGETVTEKLTFERHICIENLIIVIHLVYLHVIWFSPVSFLTFSYIFAPNWPWKPEETLNFCTGGEAQAYSDWLNDSITYLFNHCSYQSTNKGGRELRRPGVEKMWSCSDNVRDSTVPLRIAPGKKEKNDKKHKMLLQKGLVAEKYFATLNLVPQH